MVRILNATYTEAHAIHISFIICSQFPLIVHKCWNASVDAQWNGKRKKYLAALPTTHWWSCWRRHRQWLWWQQRVDHVCMMPCMYVRCSYPFAHAKTNHFTFTLIEAVAFALAVHYSFVFVAVPVVFRLVLFIPSNCLRCDFYSCNADPRLLNATKSKSFLCSIECYEFTWCMCVRACYAMLMDLFLIIFFSERYRYFYSTFFLCCFLFRWWSVFRTVDANAHSDDCNEIIYVFTLGLLQQPQKYKKNSNLHKVWAEKRFS